ncbi:unnamed protein product [Cuscuta epithymum]|uniref:Uncharacterized protein n=1 Tax=Cuscuta epithymum TaxID=186058 RepID=A0AAV0GF48_9ASTE|nr:unnamed protein product [Cuscuta epithymum]
MKFQENSQKEVRSICELVYFYGLIFLLCLFTAGVPFFVKDFSFRRIYMASDCCVTPTWWLAIRIALLRVIVSESSRKVDCDSWLGIVFVTVGLFEFVVTILFLMV